MSKHARTRPDQPSDPLLTPSEAAIQLRIDTVTLGRWARSRTIDAITLPNGHRRYRQSVIDAILAPAGAA